MSLKILQQLKCMNTRLEAVEEQVAEVRSDKQVKRRRTDEQSKISTCGNNFVTVKKSVKNLQNSSSESDSDAHSHGNLPNLATLRSSADIQHRVDSRLRQLERMQQTAGNDNNKIKSKTGGAVDVVVKHKVAWPHEAILGGVNRSRVTYDQLSLSQWVQGFVRNILDESDHGRHERMLSYMSDLMEDATDFSSQGAKDAHAVLCCELERGSVTWEDVDRINHIRRAHAQKHVSQGSKSWNKSDSAHKPWFCKFFQNGSCTFTKDHEVAGRLHKHVCARCLQQGRLLNHPEKDCVMVKKNTVPKNKGGAAHQM